MASSSRSAVSRGEEQQQSPVPYIAPFVIFFALLSLAPYFSDALGRWEFPVRAIILTVSLYVTSRRVIDLRVANPVLSLLTGAAVFFLWIGPDVLFPGYRNHWLFQNALTGQLKPGIDPKYQQDLMVLLTRSLRAVVLVPIIEELFWRAWMPRWIINPQFWKLPLGTFSWTSMIVVALLFGSEHGIFWDVGIVAGLAYNFLMVKTKRLGDCVLAHAVTNGMLSAYVILYNHWEYWP
jgi:CAAX prenyl protease-like protein